MKSASFVLPAVAVTALTTLATAQTPRMGGPMRHVMVSFDAMSNSLIAMVDPMVPTPVMQNYSESYAGNTGVLNGTMYNAQYGWMVEGFWAPPSGSFLWIEQLSADPGLLVYSGGTMMNQGTFAPIFGTAGSLSRIQWNGAMLHNWYAATTPGDYTATYRVYFGDAGGVATPGYVEGGVVLNWTAVPAPGAAAVLGLGGLLAVRRRRA